MLQWEKLGKLFDPRDHKDHPWMREFAQSPSTLVFDDIIRVYFCSRPAPDEKGEYKSYIAFIDLDRKNPSRVLRICDKPALDLGGFGTFDEFGTNPVSVIRHENHIRAYYAGWTRCESVRFNAAIGVAISNNNGESFERIGEGPVLSYTPYEPYLLGSPRIRRFNDTWYLWYAGGKRWIKTASRTEPIIKIRVATSSDGLNWRRDGADLIEDRLDEDECQAGADVIARAGRFHMFYSYRKSQNYKGKDGGYRIGYAVSDDLVKWKRNDELAGLGVSADGWDSEMANYGHVFSLDGETYMIYQGNEMGRTGIGLARLQNCPDWFKP
ncbi:glycosylase [Bradyrhizobium betae]|uniref:Glycosylase n=1 Tax=Bradyrhizobium betae TaxID=244734 RepID=A0A4Q1VF39_9BRAD|nr:glycosylase [Bradyrhizobium betae]RXT50658.1 glycosylase [Bradyrhizobium betae]